MNEESIFAAALGLPDPVKRAAYLDRACHGDAGLRGQVEELLKAHFQANPLDLPPRDLAATGGYMPEGGSACVGDRVGPYKLLEKIGEGGMGEVWVADQLEPLKRRVALKLIKPGMDSRSVLGRFEAERQALAVMDHPNIAKVLDAGTTTDGRPYFVMELVKGTPITEFCDARKLTPKERLELFVTVCHAIQHAHMKGIIHRDIKPSNVLVALHDEVPVPKVIDFGVAKAIGQQLTEKTIYTGFGALVGTPAYMAPEQASFNQLDVDTRADVYALGVLLYELLAGNPPIEAERLRKAALDEVLKIVRDEEPPRPSQRLSTSLSKATIAATRQLEPAKLSQMMKGEIDWIVMKALEKDRNRRYDTANGLAKDIQRYLAGDSVEACPPTMGYRLRKAYLRNKMAVRVASAFVSLALGAAAMGAYLAVEAKRAEATALESAEQARENAERAEHYANQAAYNEGLADSRLERLQIKSNELRHALYASDLQMAASFWQAKDRGRTLELLDQQRPQAGEPDLRGFEWHYLNRESRTAARTLCLAEGIKRFTPDGRRVYIAQRADQRKDGKTGTTLRSWDLATGKELPEWEPFPGKGVSLLTIPGINQSGTRAVLGFRIGAADPGQRRQLSYKVFDLETRKELFALKEQASGRVLNPLLDQRGRLLAVHPQDEKFRSESKVTIWNVDEQEVAQVISLDATKGEMFEQRAHAFHPNGKHFAACVTGPGSDLGMSFQLRLWDIQTGSELWRIPLDQPNCDSLVYSPEGTYLAEASLSSDTINLRQADGGKIVQSYRIPGAGNQFMTKQLSFSPDGSQLGVSLSNLPGVHVFAVSSQPDIELPPIRSIPTDSNASRVGFTADSRSVVLARTGSQDVEFYELNRRPILLPGPEQIRSPYQSAGTEKVRRPITLSGVSANHGLAWAVWAVDSSGAPKAEIRAWDATGRLVFQVQFDDLEGIYSGTMTRDGKRLILVQSNRHRIDSTLDRARIHIWDVESRVELSRKEILGESITVCGIDPTGRILAVSNHRLKRPLSPTVVDLGTRIYLWDLQTNREIHGEDILAPVNKAVMSPDGTRVAWAINPRNQEIPSSVRVWDSATGSDVWSRKDWGTRGRYFDPDRMVYSRDGRTLVVASARGPVDQVYVLDAATGADRRPPLLNADGELTDLWLSEDGRRLFALATRLRNTIVVWDLVTGRKLLTIPVNNVLGMTALTTDREGRRIYMLKDLPGSGKLELETFDGTPLPEAKK